MRNRGLEGKAVAGACVVLCASIWPAHLVFRGHEMILGMLGAWHNLRYCQDLMAGTHGAIAAGMFAGWEEDFRAGRGY